MEEYDCEAAASTIKIEDITSNEINREILRRLKENDLKLSQLMVTGSKGWQILPFDYYCAKGAHRELGWLGYFIGKHTHLQELSFRENRSDLIGEPFFRGLNRNRSIQKIKFDYINLSGVEPLWDLKLVIAFYHLPLPTGRTLACGI
jgi:hypothetical protein